MDSSLEINNKLPDSKEYVDQNSTVFERILSELESISKVAKENLSQNVFNNGKVDNALLEKFQHEAHGFAWFETYRFSLRETLSWFNKLKEQNKNSELESSILVYAFSEYLNQMRHGIMISQSEVIRPSTLGLEDSIFSFCDASDVKELISYGISDSVKQTMINSIENGIFS